MPGLRTITEKNPLRNNNPAQLRFLQVLVFLFSLITICFYLNCISNYYHILTSKCILQSCGSLAPAPPTTIETLRKYGLTPETYSFWFVSIESIFAFLFYLAGVIVFIKNRRDKIGLLAVIALVSYGTTFTSLVYLGSNGFWSQVPRGIAGIGRIALFLFLLLFPNGRMIPSWTIFVFVPFSLIQLASVIPPGSMFDLLNWSNNGRLIYYLTMIIVTIYSQIFRYRKISTSIERQQTKWVVYGVTISFLSSIIISGFFVYPVFGDNPKSYIYLSAFLYSAVSIIPLTLTLAILRHRLWDIDPLVNRTILYGILSLSIIFLYSILVLYLSSLFKTKGNFIISLFATTIVAILFSPIKERLQRIVNRVMKGRHDDPYAVLKELGNYLVKSLAPEEVLRVVAGTIKDALRLPYVGISIRVNDVEKLAAVTGKAVFDEHFFSIIHGGEDLGRLIVSSRSPDEAFSSEDRRLLDVLIQQAGPIVQNIKMTWGMQLLAHDLQESREKLVLAREEERLQIRRNLHDDLAPRLLSLSFNVAAAEQYIKKSPDLAIKLLSDLRTVIRKTVDEIRTMVHDLRPPTLDEFGLIGAIRARIEDIQKTAAQEEKAASPRGHSLQIKLNAPEQLPELPAAVEVASYRIITEAVVNVVKHAKASQCVININPNSGGSLIIEVTDDGLGLPPYIKPSDNGGIGLNSIRERTGELGGGCDFEKIETGGTRVKAWLPIS